MAYDVRLDSKSQTSRCKSPGLPRIYDNSGSDQLLFLTVKAKNSLPGEDLQDCILSELVRLHGNKVYCINEKLDGCETCTKSLNLTSPGSFVKKIAVGCNYIGILMQDGRVCRVRHGTGEKRKKPNNSPISSSARSKEPGQGTALQIASDELFARSLQDNMDRQGRGARSVLQTMVFPPATHDPRLSRLSRRYEPYSLNNRGRRVSLLPNLFEVEERTIDHPYRSNNTNLVPGPRGGQVLRFQRVPGTADLALDNMARHIPVIIGRTLGFPERVYPEAIPIPQPSLEDALNARRSQAGSLNSYSEYSNSELNEYGFSLGSEQSILTDVQRMSPLVDAQSFEDDNSVTRSTLHNPLSVDGGQRLELDGTVRITRESPDLIHFIDNPAASAGLLQSVIHPEGGSLLDSNHSSTSSNQIDLEPNDLAGSAMNSVLSPLSVSTGIDSDMLGFPEIARSEEQVSRGKIADHGSNEIRKSQMDDEDLDKSSSKDPQDKMSHNSYLTDVSVTNLEDVSHLEPIDDKAMQGIPTHFDMASILAPASKAPKLSESASCTLSSLGKTDNKFISISLDSGNQQSEPGPSKERIESTNMRASGQVKEEVAKESSQGMAFEIASRDGATGSALPNVEYPPGFRPMGGKLGFMAKKHSPDLGNTDAAKQGSSKLSTNKTSSSDDGWVHLGNLEWLDDGMEYADIAAFKSCFLLVTERTRSLKIWPVPSKESEMVSQTESLKSAQPLESLLLLKQERIKAIASSVIRATIQTQSGKFATFYDATVNEALKSGVPTLIKQLSHPCKIFEALLGEEVADMRCTLISTVVLTRSGKVFWWGLPPNSERQLLDKKRYCSTLSSQEIKVGDTIGLKRQSNEVGSLVLKFSNPLYPSLGIVRTLLSDSSSIGIEGNRKYLVDIIGNESHVQKAIPLDVYFGIGKKTVGETLDTKEDDEIRSINFSSSGPTLKKSLDSASPIALQDDEKSEVWSSTEILFLEESSSVLGNVIAIDGQFAVVSPTNNSEDKDAGAPVRLNSKGYKVFFLSTVEKVTSDIYNGSSSSSCEKTRYTNMLEVSPKLLFEPKPDGLQQASCRAVSIDVSDLGVTILVVRQSDGNVFLLHPKCVKEDNSQVFTCNRKAPVTLESLTSEANVTHDFESVPAFASNLDWLPPPPYLKLPKGKRKASEGIGQNASPNSWDDRRPKLRMLACPFTTFLFDNLGCPYPIRFLSGLRNTPQLECGPFSDMAIMEYPRDDSSEDRLITFVAAIRRLHLIPLVINGHKDLFVAKVKEMENDIEVQRDPVSSSKRPKGAPPEKNCAFDNKKTADRSCMEPDDKHPSCATAKVEWLEERCSGNQNLLHVCASNIILSSEKGAERQYFDMFHDEVSMLNTLLESSALWPWISQLLAERDANGCTPFMTALLCKNHHAAYYILKAVRRNEKMATGKSYLESVLCTPSFSGVTPVHQLIMNANRRHSMAPFNNALKVTNIPTSFSPRMMLKLFKSRYASAYRACIPSVKSRWRPMTVRSKVKALVGKEDEEDRIKPGLDNTPMLSSTLNTGPSSGTYLGTTRPPFGGERLQRANAIRTSAKEGMVQFSSLDELHQALNEMHGHGVLSETDHPSGVLTSVIQHVLNVQLYDEVPADSSSRAGNGFLRRFQPIPQNYAPLQRAVTPVAFQGGRGSAPSSTASQEQTSLAKNREDSIAKCFDDIVGFMVLARLLLVFPEIGSMVSNTQETAFHLFFKYLGRFYPSPLSKHFLSWRPCQSRRCCYKRFCHGLDITPASGTSVSGKTKRQSSTRSKRRLSSEEVRVGSEMSTNAAANSGKATNVVNSAADCGSPQGPLSRSISLQSTDYQSIAQVVPEYLGSSELLADSASSFAKLSKSVSTNEDSQLSENTDQEEPELQGAPLSTQSVKLDESESPAKSNVLRTESLDPARETFMAPSPSIMKCGVLENVDLDQLEDRADNMSNFGDQADNTLPASEGDQQVMDNGLQPTLSTQIVGTRVETFRSQSIGEVCTLSLSESSAGGGPIFRGRSPMPSTSAVGTSNSCEEVSSALPQGNGRTGMGTAVFTGDMWVWLPPTTSGKDCKSEQNYQDATTNTDVSMPTTCPQDGECVCQETSQKLPLFDRFQAPIFQLSKNWPCIVASILGVYRSDSKFNDQPSEDDAATRDENLKYFDKVGEIVESDALLPSAKLDVFTEALMASPFDILLEFLVKTTQAKVEEAINVQAIDCFVNSIDTSFFSSPTISLTDCNIPILVAQRFVRSVVRHMSLFLGKHSPMEISLRYKIRKRGKSPSKKEERLLLGLNVCLRAFSWLSVLELLRAAVATIEPVCQGTVKAQPKTIVSGLMGNTSTQMQQNVLFRPNIRIHGPQSQVASSSSVIGRMATKIDGGDSDERLPSGTQFTNALTEIQLTGKTPIKAVGSTAIAAGAVESDSDSDEENLETLEFRSTPTGRVSQSRGQMPEPMVIVEDDDDTPINNWSTGVRIRPESPSAWALNGHVTAANELSNRVVNRLFGTQPQESKASVVSLHHGNCYLARIFSRLVKEAVDLVKEIEGRNDKPSERTKPFDVTPLKFPHEIELQLKEQATTLLAKTWDWLSLILNDLEKQLELGQKYDTGHFVTRLQVPENELEYQGFGRPTQSYTYISLPEEYLLYLIKSKMGEDRGSLPVLDLLSYSHLTFVLDAYIYTKKHWPSQNDAVQRQDTKRPLAAGAAVKTPFLGCADLKVSPENARFLGEHLSSGTLEDFITLTERITSVARDPHLWLKMPPSGGLDSSKEAVRPDMLCELLDHQEYKDKMNGNEEVSTVHSQWKLTISSFCKLFLTEPPGYERESFLALEAGAAGRISRFQRSVATLRMAFRSDNGYYPMGANQEGMSTNPVLSINVRRSDLMEDCLKVFLDQMDNHPYGSLRVRFDGEEGAGPGVNRGLFASFASCLKSGQTILNWPVGLLHRPGVIPQQGHSFAPVSGRRFCTPGSEPFQGKMTAFRRRMVFVAVGRFLGLTLWFNQAIPLIFTRGVLKYLLQREDEMTFGDLAFHNASIFGALSQMIADSQNQEMTAEKFTDIYCLRFEAVVDDNVDELIPGGSEIPVTPSNVVDYVRLYTKHVLVTSIENELEGLREGLHQIIPRELLDPLSPEELQLLLSGGVESVDFARLKSIITFSNSRRCQRELFDKYKGWFWRIVKKMTAYQRQQLLHFATGSSVLPALDNRVGNNEELAITVDVIDGNTNALPMASTCGQRISLPLYPTRKHLKRKLLQAIECQVYGLG